MSGYLQIIKKETKPHLSALKDDIAARRDPSYFWPCGTQVYCGAQGSGKTISLVKHTLDTKTKYPAAILVSNLDLNDYEPIEFHDSESLATALSSLDPETSYIRYSTAAQLALALTGVNNGFKGVIYVIDEIHTYFNSLESKEMPMWVFTEISQQRKQRKLILGTSQLFLRMSKPLREQCDSLIICKTSLGVFTSQKAYDGMTLTQDYDGSLSGHLKRLGWFFHTRQLRAAFDTYQKVQSSQVQFEDLQNPGKMKNRGAFGRRA